MSKLESIGRLGYLLALLSGCGQNAAQPPSQQSSAATDDKVIKDMPGSGPEAGSRAGQAGHTSIDAGAPRQKTPPLQPDASAQVQRTPPQPTDAATAPQDAAKPTLPEDAGTPTTRADAGANAPDTSAPMCTPYLRLGCASTTSYRVCSFDGRAEVIRECPPDATRCVKQGDCVQCTEDECSAPGSLAKCVDGSYREMPCTEAQTCLVDTHGAGCAGSCRAGTFRCNPASKNAEHCLPDASWQVEVCDSNQICVADATSASCQTNAEYDFGNKDALTAALWEPFSPNPEQIYFLPLVPTHKAFVAELRLTGSAAGGACRMSLYDDAAGLPNQKLFSIAENFAVSAGGITGIRPPITVELSAGTTYWIAAACGVTTSGSPVLFQKSVAGQRFYVMATASFSDFMPVMIPAPGLSLTHDIALSFFVQLLDVP